MRTRFRTSLVFVVMTVSACSQRTTMIEGGPAAPSPVTTAGSGPVPPPSAAAPAAPLPVTVADVVLRPEAMFGGASGSGTVLLTRPAPVGGATVALTTTDNATVTVPPTVTVSEGADRASFAIATRTVAVDQRITISGATPGGSSARALSLWSRSNGSFFVWYDEAGTGLGAAGFGHWTTPTATFFPLRIGVGQNTIDLSVRNTDQTTWSIVIGAPGTDSLRVGTYENARGFVPNHDAPTLNLTGSRIGCSQQSGRFEVRDIAFGPDGLTQRADIVFETTCASLAARIIRGEMQFVAGQ